MEAQKPLEQETPETTPQEAPTATIPQPESTPAANMEADPIPEEMDASPESPAKKTAGKLAALIGGGIVAVLGIFYLVLCIVSAKMCIRDRLQRPGGQRRPQGIRQLPRVYLAAVLWHRHQKTVLFSRLQPTGAIDGRHIQLLCQLRRFFLQGGVIRRPRRGQGRLPEPAAEKAPAVFQKMAAVSGVIGQLGRRLRGHGDPQLPQGHLSRRLTVQRQGLSLIHI